jgi:hypothetical protein
MSTSSGEIVTNDNANCLCFDDYDDDVYLHKSQQNVLQNLFSKMNNADHPIWHK